MKYIIILLGLMLLIGSANAIKTVDIPMNITTVMDGVAYTHVENLKLTFAEAPPKLNIEMYAIRNDTFEPYAGPYMPGEKIQMNVQVQVQAGQPCADRIIVEAPVYDPVTNQTAIRKVIDTMPYASTVCPGPKYGMHWMWWDGLVELGPDGNPIN